MPLVVSLARNHAEKQAAREVEAAVFGEVFGNTREQLVTEYGPYEEASHFLLCREAGTDGPIAVARLIAPSPAGLKTLVDIVAEPWNADRDFVVRQAGLDPERTWDVATLAALPHARRGEASAALYASLVNVVTRAGGTSWTAIIDSKVLVLLRRAGVSAQALPGLAAAPYLGSPSSLPIYGRVADTRLRPAPSSDLTVLAA